jgi:hypothetical protein
MDSVYMTHGEPERRQEALEFRNIVTPQCWYLQV